MSNVGLKSESWGPHHETFLLFVLLLACFYDSKNRERKEFDNWLNINKSLCPLFRPNFSTTTDRNLSWASEPSEQAQLIKSCFWFKVTFTFFQIVFLAKLISASKKYFFISYDPSKAKFSVLCFNLVNKRERKYFMGNLALIYAEVWHFPLVVVYWDKVNTLKFLILL